MIGFLEKLLYKENGTFGEKAALSVILMFAIASPLPSLFSDLGEFPFLSDTQVGDLVGGEYQEVTKEAFEEGLGKQIAEEFSLKNDSVRVKCVGFIFSEMKAEKIIVTLSVSAAGVDPKKVEKYIDGFDIGKCEVQFEIG